MKIKKEGKHLGDFCIVPDRLEFFEEVCKGFRDKEFLDLDERQKIERVNQSLLSLIQKTPPPCFLLPAVIAYVDKICQEKIIERYSFSNFELWLNQFSGLTPQENYRVRASIVGKWVPRDTYQILFPVSMGKVYPGSHFVTAHQSPDLDTTVASFWGWMDAFGARVAEGRHLWNVPGGPPASQVEIEILFTQLFGEGIFTHLAKTRVSLALSSADLLSQKGVVRQQTNVSTLAIDHERNQNAIVLVDEKGYYLGDWRNFDVEGVRQVIVLLNNCLRWFENSFHVRLISLFAKENLSLKDLPTFFQSIAGVRIEECQPAKEFTKKQKKHLHDYLQKVLGVHRGMESTFEEFVSSMRALSLFDFQEFIDLIERLGSSGLFEPSGDLCENRPRLFHYLERIIRALDTAIQSVGNYVERLDVALSIKTRVFGYLPQVVNYQAEVEELRSKIGAYPYLTVTYPSEQGSTIPLGVVHAGDLHKSILGTVSLRDFCNREEVKIPSYLEIISVIDHHKSALATSSPPLASISDAQSSNVLVAKLAFEINDCYSTGGMTLEEIKAQINEIKKDHSSDRKRRILQRLLQRESVAEKKGSFFVDPKREFIEYLHFLYAILDDTDLLTKVSARDVECVGSLLNRLKSLLLKKEVEVIDFDDLQRDDSFAREAASRVMQNIDMYSLYSKIYLSKESAIEHNLTLSIQGLPSSIFSDTKEQNGCCRVGQTKMFAKNFSTFNAKASSMRSLWARNAEDFYKEKTDVDLHLHMISTIAGAEDLFAGTAGNYAHKDEIWIWIPWTEQAIVHLKSFLNAFKTPLQALHNEFEVDYIGKDTKEIAKIFSESFFPVHSRALPPVEGGTYPLAILRFKAGLLNSRKAMITPYLPKLIS